MEEVDLSSFARAIARLEEGYAALSADPGNMLFRDAVIKRFEFTYELSQTTLRRFVETYSPNKDNPGHITTPDLIRTANQDNLLKSDWSVWHGYRDARNKTSHTYKEDQAIAVIQVIPAFLDEVRFLHARMEAYPR